MHHDRPAFPRSPRQALRAAVARLVAWLRARFTPGFLLLTGGMLFALLPLLDPGYFYSAHDGRHSVFYVMMFDASLRDGALWPRWAMHHLQGYGYPTFILQAPLGFYLAQLFVWMGAGYTLAVKWTWAVAILTSGWGMAALVRAWLDRSEPGPAGPRHDLAAAVAGLLYVYAPYHLADMYVRAALNDTLLMAWFPWVFLAFERLFDRDAAADRPRRIAVAAFALGGCLLTHTFALLSFTPVLMTFVLFRLALVAVQSPMTLRAWLRYVGAAAAAGLLALLLIAAFLFPLLIEGPMLEQTVYVTNTYDYRNHFVYWGQFFSPFWGYGYSDDPAGANDGMGFQVGAPALILGILAAFALVRESEPRSLRRAYLGYLALISFVLLYLMTPAAAPVWAAVPPLAVIQFPWRLLALSAFTVAALGGLIVPALVDVLHTGVNSDGSYDADTGRANGADEAWRGGSVLLAMLAIYASYGYIGAPTQPVEPWREDGRAVYYFEREHPDMIAVTRWARQSFTTSPMSADYAAAGLGPGFDATRDLTRLAIIRGEGEVLSHYSGGSSGGGVVRVEGPATVRVHLTYFPGWRATVDGQPVPLRVSDPHGLIELDVPGGTHRIDVRMGATPPRTAGAVVSWATLVLLVGLLGIRPRAGLSSR